LFDPDKTTRKTYNFIHKKYLATELILPPKNKQKTPQNYKTGKIYKSNCFPGLGNK